MTRLALVAAFFLLVASPAAAQWDASSSAAFQLAPPTDASTDMLSTATSQHRVGAALIATGLMANAAGAVGSLFSLIAGMSVEEPACVRGSCTGGSGGQTDWGAMFGVSVGTAGLGLVLFFVGLGLDIHAHVLRGHAGEVRLAGNGLTVTF